MKPQNNCSLSSCQNRVQRKREAVEETANEWLFKKKKSINTWRFDQVNRNKILLQFSWPCLGRRPPEERPSPPLVWEKWEALHVTLTGSEEHSWITLTDSSQTRGSVACDPHQAQGKL